MKCPMKYEWVKLPRNLLPQGKGILGEWTRLAARAAFRGGTSKYCGHINEVPTGGWVGGIVGIKSILEKRQKGKALAALDTLAQQGYLHYQLHPKTKRLAYQISDWVSDYCGEPCEAGTVYTTEGYGFFCLPRNITQRLVEQSYHFEEADAWLDLWCHTVWQEPDNAFSSMAPCIQLGRYGSALTLETLGHRWGWEKTKVWRFLHKHRDTFALRKLPSSYGCVIFNRQYPTSSEIHLPPETYLTRFIDYLACQTVCISKSMTENERINRLIAMFSIDFEIILRVAKRVKTRVAALIYAYLSPTTRVETENNDCRNRTIAFFKQGRYRFRRSMGYPLLC